MSEEVQQLQSYPVPPTTTDGLSSEDAQNEIDKLQADSQIAGHPLNPDTFNHPQAKQYANRRQSLFEVIHTDNRPELTILMEQGMKEQKQRDADAQAERVVEAKKDMDVLEKKYDFNRIDIPSDISEFRARSIREQKFLAQKNINELQPMLLKDLQSLNAPSDKIEMLSGVMLAHCENRLGEEHIQNAKILIKWIIDENVRKEIKNRTQRN